MLRQAQHDRLNTGGGLPC